MKTLFSFALILFVCFNLNAQDFTSSPFITLPGDNYDINVLCPWEVWLAGTESYICWVNKQDTIYTVYLKKLTPDLSNEIVVSSDTIPKSNPQISYYRIAWQEYSDNYWQIWQRNLHNDTLGVKTLLVDSLTNDPQITLNNYRLGYVDNGKIKELYGEFNEIVVVDSVNCSSPDLPTDDYLQYTKIIYEKGLPNQKDIFVANLNTIVSPEWEKTKLSTESNNINPKFGFLDFVSFQMSQDSLWNIVFENIPWVYESINIPGCSLKNPVIFAYDLLTKGSSTPTPYFVVFEKDSADFYRSDICIYPFYYGESGPLINVSNIPGKNYQPEIGFMFHSDTAYISIFWINELDGKKDIWVAESIYNPLLGAIENKTNPIKTFSLNQNYPNPFNPVTYIEYFIAKPGMVSLIIYNVLGEKINVLEDGFKVTGNYKTAFDAQNYPSGMYYYTLKAGNFSETKSMLLIK